MKTQGYSSVEQSDWASGYIKRFAVRLRGPNDAVHAAGLFTANQELSPAIESRCERQYTLCRFINDGGDLLSLPPKRSRVSLACPA